MKKKEERRVEWAHLDKALGSPLINGEFFEEKLGKQIVAVMDERKSERENIERLKRAKKTKERVGGQQGVGEKAE